MVLMTGVLSSFVRCYSGLGWVANTFLFVIWFNKLLFGFKSCVWTFWLPALSQVVVSQCSIEGSMKKHHLDTIWVRDGEMEGVLVTGRIWVWAETPNVRVTGDKDKLVSLLEASSLHRCTHLTFLLTDTRWRGASWEQKKKKDHCNFHLASSIALSLAPSLCDSLAISRWVHSLVLSNIRRK